MLGEFFGDLERLAAEAYPYRWPITAGVLLGFAALAAFAYRMGWHRTIWRYRLPVAIVSIPLMGLGIFVGYELGSPLFVNKTVVEELPFAVERTTERVIESTQDVIDGTAPLAVSEGGPESTPTVSSETRPTLTLGEDATPVPNVADETAPLSSPEGDESPDAAAAVAVSLKTGEFRDQDALHKGSGQATIYRGPDGTHLLRLDDLNVTNGPDLFVLLSPHHDPNNPDEARTEGYVNLGELKGNRGNQNYSIPSDVDVPSQRSVIIYCKAFSVIFSVAPLQDVG